MNWKLVLVFGLMPAAPAYGAPYSTNGDALLAGYIAEALEGNPSVRESLARYRAALQRLPQAAALPDPMLQATQFARSPETRVGAQTTSLSVSQRFPWFGKRGDRRQAAAKEAAALARNHEAAKAEVVRRVKLAYYDLAYIDRAARISEQDLDLLDHFETLAQARYAQGVGLQQAALKLQAEITRGLANLETLRRQRTDAEAVLNKLRDRRADEPAPPIELPDAPAAPFDFAALREAARRHRPEIAAAFERVEGGEKRLHLARSERLPDVTVGAGFINVLGRGGLAGGLPHPGNGKNIYSVTVGVNLPISRRKYDAAALEATERLIAAKQRYRETVNETDLAVRSVGFRLQTIRRQIDLFQSALLPQAEQALRSTEAAYATATVGVLDLLDSERMLLEVRLGLARLQSDFMKSLAEMERAVGTAFPADGADAGAPDKEKP